MGSSDKTYCMKHYRQTFPGKGCDMCELEQQLAAANKRIAELVSICCQYDVPEEELGGQE